MAWNEERVELLKKLWAEGLSAGQICGRIRGTTRNSVIGKVHRLGLEGRATPVGKNRLQSMRSARAAARVRSLSPIAKARGLAMKPAARFAAESLPPEPPRPEKLVKFVNLTDGQCRFPFGDPKTSDFGFCGCEKVHGTSYCAGHLAMCTTAPTPRKKVTYYNEKVRKHLGRIPTRMVTV